MVGLGEIVGALIMSQIIDRVPIKILGIINVVNLLPVWALAIAAIFQDSKSAVVYVFAFSWGYMDA